MEAWIIVVIVLALIIAFFVGNYNMGKQGKEEDELMEKDLQNRMNKYEPEDEEPILVMEQGRNLESKYKRFQALAKALGKLGPEIGKAAKETGAAMEKLTKAFGRLQNPELYDYKEWVKLHFEISIIELKNKETKIRKTIEDKNFYSGNITYWSYELTKVTDNREALESVFKKIQDGYN